MTIAVTGGYGSGKSSVSRLLARYLDAKLTNADSLCRALLEPEQEGFRQLQNVFGERFIAQDGSLDRNHLRKATFNDLAIKETLENILHPLVRNSIRHQARTCSLQHWPLVVEVPLLFEVGWQDDFDVSVLVRVDRQTCVQRAVKRDCIVAEEAERVIELQLPMSCKVPLADYIIDNSDTFVSTAQQAAWLSTLLCKENCR